MRLTIQTKLTSKAAMAILFAGLFSMSACKKESVTDAISNEPTALAGDPNAVVMMTAGANYMPNEVLVKFRKGISPTNKGLAIARMRATVQEVILTKAMQEAGEAEGIYLMKMPIGVMEAIHGFKNLPEVDFAEPNFIYTHCATSNDPYFTNGSLWGMYSIGSSPANAYGISAVTAWANGKTGSNEVIVAVIDEGVMNTHADLAANCWINPYDKFGDKIDNDGNGYKDDKWGWDFAGNNNTTYDGVADDHGTHVAGTIGAVGGNSKGVAGVNWNIKMISCKFLGSTGGTTANAIKAIDYVTNLKKAKSLNIVATNNSWGGGGFSQALKDAIDRADAQNILFVAAAGNNGGNNDVVASYPASYTSANVIAVAAIDNTGKLASFSQYGATSVDIGAPGVGIFSTLPTSKNASTYGSYNGTSMATPHVTGAVALYASLHAGSTAAQIKAAVLGSAVATASLTGKCTTGGRVDVSSY